jgi:hypothetical protein
MIDVIRNDLINLKQKGQPLTEEQLAEIEQLKLNGYF